MVIFTLVNPLDICDLNMNHFINNVPTYRANLLADIAEMYFIEGKSQNEIAEFIGVSRSNISRMLKEARSSGIVQISIDRPLDEDHHLAEKLIKRFNLINARVINVGQSVNYMRLLGKAASQELISAIKPGTIIGTSWGTGISTTVDELENITSIQDIKVVQLLGALGARIKEYDAHSIVNRLAKKLGAEGYYINAPFLVDENSTADSLLKNRNIQETIQLGKQADIALLGVGSTEDAYCSFFKADYVTRNEIEGIQQAGAIGDVCGRFFDKNGQMTAKSFQDKLIGISLQDLLHIPVRLGIAGGPAKIQPIIGALRGRLINSLVSDSKTISEVLNRTSG